MKEQVALSAFGTDSDGISTIGIFWLKMNEWKWCWQAIKYKKQLEMSNKCYSD
jgi:hypothetical protein